MQSADNPHNSGCDRTAKRKAFSIPPNEHSESKSKGSVGINYFNEFPCDNYFNLSYTLIGALPAHPLERELISIFNCPWDVIRAPEYEPGSKAQWYTVLSSGGKVYPLRPRALMREFHDPNHIIGVKPGKATRYALIDIDIHSENHPYNNSQRFNDLLEAIAHFGFPVVVLNFSSHTEGLHIWLLAPDMLPTWYLGYTLQEFLREKGFKIASGQLEIFPNVKPFEKDVAKSTYQRHRIPCQTASGGRLVFWDRVSQRIIEVTDSENTLASWLAQARYAMAQCNINLVRQRIKDAYDTAQGYGHQGRMRGEDYNWRKNCEAIIAQGWTGDGQTNDLLFIIAQYGRVFKRLGGIPLAEWIASTARNLPGYEQFCDHQHNIEKRARDWAKFVALGAWNGTDEPNRYEPYCQLPQEQSKGSFSQKYAAECQRSTGKVVAFNGNEIRSEEARQRIKSAVTYLQEQGELPDGALRRAEVIISTAKRITGKGISQLTLRKKTNLPLWHPEYVWAKGRDPNALHPDWFAPWFDPWAYCHGPCGIPSNWFELTFDPWSSVQVSEAQPHHLLLPGAVISGDYSGDVILEPSTEGNDSSAIAPDSVVRESCGNLSELKLSPGADSSVKLTPFSIYSLGSGEFPWVYITDGVTLASALNSYRQATQLAIDTETTGLDPHSHTLRLLQVAAPGLPVLILDLQEIPETAWQPIRELFSSTAIKIFHNAKFDYKFLYQAGIEVRAPFFDTMLASQLLSAGQFKAHSLQALASDYLGVQLPKQLQKSNWSEQLTPEQLEYAARDAQILLQLREVLRAKLLEADLKAVALLEFEVIPAVAHIEMNGMLLDRGRWAILQADTQTALDGARVKLLDAGIDPEIVNLNAPAQLKEALKASGIVVKDTSKDTLIPLASQHPAIAALLEYRKFSKLQSAFTDKYFDCIHPVTSRIHPTLNQLGCRTGRMSASQPNLQQVPRDIEVRSCFIAAPDYKLISADYSQIELRVAAEIANDFRMIKAYKRGDDLHTLTAALIKHMPGEPVTPAERKAAKAINFGLIYGCGAKTLRETAKSKFDVDMTLDEAKTYRNQFFEVYKGISIWHKQLMKARLMEVRTRSNRLRVWTKKPPITAISNSIVQGTAADILKHALAKLPAALSGTGAKIIGAIHDEILLECPSETVDAAILILRRTMIVAGRTYIKQVPIEVDIVVGDSWGMS